MLEEVQRLFVIAYVQDLTMIQQVPVNAEKVEVCSRVQEGYAMIDTLCVFPILGAFSTT